jgi:hypothetical protein
MTQQLLDMPVRVLAAWKVGSEPSSTKVMLMLSEGPGHHTEYLDLQDFDTWLTEHHPEVYSPGDDGKSQFDLRSLPSHVLAPCLTHCRTKRREERLAEQGARYEVGYLIDPDHPAMHYAAVGTAWQPQSHGCNPRS